MSDPRREAQKKAAAWAALHFVEPGMVVGVELAGGGVLDQDLVLVDPDGSQVLTTLTIPA